MLNSSLKSGLPWVAVVAATAVLARRRPPRALPPPPRPDRRDGWAVAAYALIGVALFTLPDMCWRAWTGQFVWVSDPDDLLYLTVASQAYHNHPFSLSDPARAEGGLALYSWLPLVPGILLAKLLGLGPVGVGLAWRVLAGATVPLGWYLLLRRYLPSATITAVAVVLLTADVGSMAGEPLVRQAGTVASLVRGDPSWLRLPYRSAGVPWRITTPGNIFIFFAAYLALLLRAREAPTRARVVAAGVAYGLLFYVFFYYWTAAGLALALSTMLDSGRRRVHATVGGLGVLIGLPALVAGSLTRAGASEALIRFELFMEADWPVWMFSVGETGLIAAVLTWTWFRRPDLFPVSALIASGWALANQHLLSKILIQGDHWRLHAFGPAMTLLEVLLVLGGLPALAGRRRRVASALLVALCAADLAAGVALRLAVATRAWAPLVQINNQLRYRDQRRRPGLPPLAPNAVVAGDPAFVSWAMILDNQRMLSCPWLIRHSLTVGHDEWNDRVALNGYVQGLDRAAFREAQRRRIGSDFFGPWTKDETRRAALLDERTAAYDEVAADPRASLDRFTVRYLGLPPGAFPPDQSACGWQLLEAGPHWWVWRRQSGQVVRATRGPLPRPTRQCSPPPVYLIPNWTRP